MSDIEPMTTAVRSLGIRASTWAALRPDERMTLNGTAAAAEPLPTGITQEVWAKLPPEVQRALREAQAKRAEDSMPMPVQAGYVSHYTHDDDAQDAIEAVIARRDLLHKIRDHIGAAGRLHDRSLWALFEEFAQPLTLEQAAVLYACEELYGEQVIEINGEYLAHFTLTGAPIWGEKSAS